MTAFLAPSSTNGYLPVATGQVIAFVRKPKSFKTLNAIVQYTPSELPSGVYSRLDRDNGVRVSNEDQFLWADGSDMPSNAYFTSRFTTGNFMTIRRAYPWTVGAQAQKNARLWNPKLTTMMEAISLDLTFRTLRLIRLLTTTGTWGAGNTQTATLLGGGKLNAGTVANPYFKNCFLAAAAVINKATNGIIEIDDLVAILNRDDVTGTTGGTPGIASSAEILDFMKGSVWTQTMITDPFSKVNMQWGLPDRYNGIRICVSTEPMVTETMNTSGNEATTNRSLIMPSGSCIIACQPGTMDNELSERSYSTVQIFHYAGEKAASQDRDGQAVTNGGDGLLEVVGRFDGYNRKWDGAVVEQCAESVAAPMSGFLITAIV